MLCACGEDLPVLMGRSEIAGEVRARERICSVKESQVLYIASSHWLLNVGSYYWSSIINSAL